MARTDRGPDLASTLLDGKQIAPQFDRLPGRPEDECVVNLADLLPLELLTNFRGELAIARREDHAGRG